MRLIFKTTKCPVSQGSKTKLISVCLTIKMLGKGNEIEVIQFEVHDLQGLILEMHYFDRQTIFIPCIVKSL